MNEELSAIKEKSTLPSSVGKAVKVAITDLDGVLRGKYIALEKFQSALESGFGFCNVVFGWDLHDACLADTQYTGWHTGYPDALVKLDMTTRRSIPWEPGCDLVLGDFWEDNLKTPLAVCPRQLLKRVVKYAEHLGFDTKCGLEFEWYNFAESPQSVQERHFTDLQLLTPGMFGYSVIRSGLNRDYFQALFHELLQFRVPLEGLHCESGPGVIEGALAASSALEAADRGILLKTAVKEIAYRFGYLPSFMAKWNAKLPGSSGHLHQSLLRRKSGENAFYDSHSSDHLSADFRHYIAGQVQLLPSFLTFLAPNVNSYKRFVPGVWAPTRMNWGYDNRTAALRVLSCGPKATRLETRIGGADINPYLAIAAALWAGLYGIEHKLELTQPPQLGNQTDNPAALGKEFPTHLHAAAQMLKNEPIAREFLGDTLLNHWLVTREWEWKRFESAVTDYELARYLEIV